MRTDGRTDGLTEIQTNVTSPVGALHDLAISLTSSIRKLYSFCKVFQECSIYCYDLLK